MGGERMEVVRMVQVPAYDVLYLVLYYNNLKQVWLELNTKTKHASPESNMRWCDKCTHELPFLFAENTNVLAAIL